MDVGTGRVAASLRVKALASGPRVYGRWRAPDGAYVERPVGNAWMVRDGDAGARPNGRTVGQWRDRRGRPPEGYLTADMARERLPEVVAAWRGEEERAQAEARRETQREVTFAEVAEEWLRLRSRSCKPSTMRDYRNQLREGGRVLEALGPRAVVDVQPADVRDLLDGMEQEGASPRTVNKVLQTIGAVFELAAQPAEHDRQGRRTGGGFGLDVDAMRPDMRRREDRPARLDVYSPEEVAALARAAEQGAHRKPRAEDAPETLAEAARRREEDRQDAAIIVTAAFTGLRLGELLALRWRDADFEHRRVTVHESWSAGQTTSPKGGHARSVPLADQPAQALARLSQRPRFTDRDSLVFCGRSGEHLDDSALRRRYRAAQASAGVRPLRFHDLRHVFGSLATARFGPVAVKEMMGHSDLKTTSRYLHAVVAGDEADRLSRAFGGGEVGDVEEAVR